MLAIRKSGCPETQVSHVQDVPGHDSPVPSISMAYTDVARTSFYAAALPYVYYTKMPEAARRAMLTSDTFLPIARQST